LGELLAQHAAAAAAATDDESDMTQLITGSELVIAGDIARKVGDRRFT